MSITGKKFGTFKGVFTPSLLSILGVIMFLRLPWIVGEAGLIATLGIILVAHIISVTTGLSISSIATDKKVETGGTYYIISRSLGLPIGGTLGIAFFVGLSFSVSLYLIGFSEVFLSAMGLEVTKNLIRITGVLALLFITVLSFISTNLALKTQIFILLIILLSLASIFLGQHDYQPGEPILSFASESFTWIALFAIFFPAVTGFTAGSSMSGNLRNPNKAIPIGTISAILVGLLVYTGLAIFLSKTVDRQLLIYDPAVLLNISLFAPVVIAGIWGATLSSALGSILGAPRILQATAIDKITPKIFAKSFGKANEPRNALLLTFAIALIGILIGDLNVIARLVTIFFIITYGFLNLTCAIENWAGSDFRPSFRIPVLVSIIGGIACFIVMVQLDLIAMLIAILILGIIFFIIKRKELRLQSGDTWNGVWSSIIKYGLTKLSKKGGLDKRNWRPNIILFSGGAKSRPHLVEMARSMVGRMGVFTNFELIENPSEKLLFSKQAQSFVDTDNLGNPVFTRKHESSDIYEGMDLICRVYGFSGFEPNTVLLGWSRNTKNPNRFVKALNNFIQLNYNIAILSFDRDNGFGNRKSIDLWWKGYGKELSYGLTLLKFITSDPAWRSAKLRVLIINYESSSTETIYDLTRQMIDNTRLLGEVKVINNSVERLSEAEIIKNESGNSDLTLLPIENKDLHPETTPLEKLSEKVSQLKTTILIKAGSEFDEVNVFGDEELELIKDDIVKDVTETPVIEQIKYPDKEILASEIYNISKKFQNIHIKYLKNGFGQASIYFNNYLDSFKDFPKKLFAHLEKLIETKDKHHGKNPLDKTINDYAYQVQNHLLKFTEEILPDSKTRLSEAINDCCKEMEEGLREIPEKVYVNFEKHEFSFNRREKSGIRFYKMRKKLKSKMLRRPVKQKIELKKTSQLFLYNRRLKALDKANNDFRTQSYKMVASLKNHFSDILETLEKIQKNFHNYDKALQIARMEGQRLAIQQENIQKETTQTFEKIRYNLNSDLFINLQKICYLTGSPVSKFILKPYEKVLKKGFPEPHAIKEMPETWFSNLKLFISKSNLEFLLVAFKNRIKSKLHKKVNELTLFIESNMLKNLQTLKEQVELFKKHEKTKEPDSLRLILNEQKHFDLHKLFEQFFEEVQEIINELPEKTDINTERFIQQMEEGKFGLSEVKSIAVRQKVEFYIGTELINNMRVELDNLAEKLNRSSQNIRDIIRLTLFNLENVDKETKEVQPRLLEQETKTLLTGLHNRIEKEEQSIIKLIESTTTNLDSYLNSALENINIVSLSHKTEPGKKRRTRKKDSLFNQKIKKNIQSISQAFRNQMVNALYTKSESLMLAQKLTRFEKQHKISGQAVHEIIEALTPQKKILKEIPFYYQSLFSGSSTINKDLWIGMKKQLREAEITFKRFNNGYSGGLLITGERDSGKSSLSKIISKKYLSAYHTHIIKAPKGETPNAELFDKTLKNTFNTDKNITDYLNAQPDTKVIIIDDIELWWHRAENGQKYLNKFFELINNFGNKHFFIVNCNTHAFNFLNNIYHFDGYFLGHVQCEPLDARGLKEMIMLRHKAGGLKFELNRKNEDDFSEWDFAKLFNKYFELTKGNPGQTAKAWISNIMMVRGDLLVIKSPKKPPTQHLNDINDDLWIVILQFILHRRLDIEKLSKVLHQTHNQTLALLQNLLRAGIVEEKFERIYALNPYLEQILASKLKNKNML